MRLCSCVTPRLRPGIVRIGSPLVPLLRALAAAIRAAISQKAADLHTCTDSDDPSYRMLPRLTAAMHYYTECTAAESMTSCAVKLTAELQLPVQESTGRLSLSHRNLDEKRYAARF